MTAIKTQHLPKRYGDILGSDDVNVTIGSIRIRGLLGRNGAGKTTLMKLRAPRRSSRPRAT